MIKAIRGATTVNKDCAEEIKDSVKELLCEIKNRNNISNDCIICIMFSNTADIKSYYPAKAAREAGFSTCALYSSVEPQIEDSLKRCIRVMLITESSEKPEHVYLRGASVLRKDLTEKINIAIDGPAGSGKSTIAKLLAKRYDILYLDTGAMYRAVAYACLNAGLDVGNEACVQKLLDSINITVEYKDGVQKTILNGIDVSEKIRLPEISMNASKVSAYEFVRSKMVVLQRKIAAANSCILDGRDIGSNVLPKAKFKFYLTASPEIRAKRREKENTLKGYNQPYNEVLKEINIRDEQDKSRKIAPLIKAEDAIEIDTGFLSIEEVLDLINKNIQEKI